MKTKNLFLFAVIMMGFCFSGALITLALFPKYQYTVGWLAGLSAMIAYNYLEQKQ